MRPMSDQDLSIVLSWRNHPSVRAHMYTQHEILPEEHQAWFHRCKEDPKRHLFIFEKDAVPLGFIQLTQQAETTIADWGFYASPAAPAGTGRQLGKLTLDHAFRIMSLHKLCGQVIGSNTRSQGMHKALGFSQEGILRQQFHNGQSYQDIILFGILREEWIKQATEKTE